LGKKRKEKKEEKTTTNDVIYFDDIAFNLLIKSAKSSPSVFTVVVSLTTTVRVV